MARSAKNSPKTDLERSALEMIKAARRLAKIEKSDHLWAGTCKAILRRLTSLEKQIYKQRNKAGSQSRLIEIADELSNLIGNLCKSLIRYQYHFQLKCCWSFIFMRSVNIKCP